MNRDPKLGRWAHAVTVASCSVVCAACSSEPIEGSSVDPFGSGTQTSGGMPTPGGPVAGPLPSGSATDTPGVGTAGPGPAGTNGPSLPMGAGGMPPLDPVENAACAAEETLASKRLVRLTFTQLGNTLGVLLGEELSAEVAERFELTSPYQRTFPPLNNPREGAIVIDTLWQTNDGIAQHAAQYVVDNFGAVTGCGEPATEECARTYSNDFAARAFRRPLDADEQASFEGIFDLAIDEGLGVVEATRYSVYGALSAPQFLYRAEFGADANSAGRLTPYEIASMLSYFVTDGPPDTALLDAAANGGLDTPAQLEDQVDRLLQLPAAKLNLQSAMYSYFGVDMLAVTTIDTRVAPAFTESLRSSMMQESELFINHQVENGTVEDLLGSRTTFVNEELAELYGIEFPPPGAVLDENGFAQVELPETRSGILTQPAYLTTRSRPEEASVVGRGLLINASLLCGVAPPFPDALAETIEEVNASLEGMTEREKADYRMADATCGGCHQIFDPYGVALEHFDIIGAHRENYVMHDESSGDERIVPIDASVKLPPAAGGATVTNAADMAQQLIESGAFTRCVSKNLIAYAMAEGSSVAPSSCTTQAVVEGLNASDRSLRSLVREVVKSAAFVSRAAGGEQ